MDRIKALIQINLKLYFERKILAWVTLLFPIAFFVFFSWLFTDYDAVDKIPVVLIDQDQTEISKAVSTAIYENPSLKLEALTLEEALSALEYNRIEAIITLKSGFEEGIKNNVYSKIVTLSYLDKSVIAPALTDIIASDMLTYVTLYRSANLGVKYEKKYELDDIYNKIISKGNTLINDEHFEMEVITKVIAPENDVVINTNISKLLKYNTTIGYTLMVLAFVLMISQSHLFDDRPIKNRLLQSGYKKYQVFLGDFISICLIGCLITVVQVITLFIGLDLTLLSTLIITCSILVFVVFLSLLIMLLTVFIQKKVIYQSIITPFLFLIGLIGGAFWSIELLAATFKSVAQISPVYWVLNSIHSGLLGIYHKSFITLLFFLLSLVILYIFTYSCYRKKTIL